MTYLTWPAAEKPLNNAVRALH